MNKSVVILGGGTFSHILSHLALSAPAFGSTAKRLYSLCKEKFTTMDVNLVLTKMADSSSDLVTNKDVEHYVNALIKDNTTKVVFFNIAMCDYTARVANTLPGKYQQRLESSEGDQIAHLYPDVVKVVQKIRKQRKDIFLVAFKTTCGASEEEQFSKALNLMKKGSINLVIANDTLTRSNFIVTPEEGVYRGTREEVLAKSVDMAYMRSHLSFTRSTVVEGKPVPWSDNRIYSNLRESINWLVSQGAYKEFNGATTGHFAAKLSEGHFLTSIRKTNFKDIANNGMVEVKTDGNDQVIAFGARPSVGGQSQRIIFNEYPDLDCIVHFHCPLKPYHKHAIPVMSQWEYECGSHQCGENTKNGLTKFGNLYAVMLDKHGPNIVFSKDTDPQEVIQFIKDNFDLSKPTNGFEKVYM